MFHTCLARPMNPHLPELRNQIAQHVELQKQGRARRLASESRFSGSSGASRASDENTVQGPIPDASCFGSTCSSFKRAVTSCASSCSRCLCHPLERAQESTSVHELPGVTFATSAGVGAGGVTGSGANAGVAINKDTLNAHQKNLSSLIDYAAKNLNVAVSVDSAKLLDNAVDVIASKIRELENVKHAASEIFFAGAAYKQGSRVKSHWKPRYFRLTYGGQLQWFMSEDNVTPKGFFQLTSSSMVEPITRDGAYYLTRIQSGAGTSFAFACNTVEQCNVWAAKFRSLIESMKKKRAQSISSRTRASSAVSAARPSNAAGVNANSRLGATAGRRNISNTSIISALS